MDVDIKGFFYKVTNVVYAAILLLVTLGIIIGTLRLFYSLWEILVEGGITGQYLDFIADVFTLFVLVEISKSMIEYFDVARIRMTYLIDAGIVFVLREIIIQVFSHAITPEVLYALSFLLLVLGIIRMGSILLYQREMSLG